MCEMTFVTKLAGLLNLLHKRVLTAEADPFGMVAGAAMFLEAGGTAGARFIIWATTL